MQGSSILEKLNWRYAVKQFDSSKTLSEEQLHLLQESLRLSPSSFGLQPWKFLLVKDSETRKKLLEKCWNQAQVVDASHVFVLCRPDKVGEKDIDRFIQATADTRGMPMEALEGYSKMIKGFLHKFSEAQTIAWMEKQVYLALGNLLTTCALANIDACPMEGFEPPAVDEILGLSQKGLRSVVLCPVGFRLDSDKYASLKKVRYPLNDVIEVL